MPPSRPLLRTGVTGHKPGSASAARVARIQQLNLCDWPAPKDGQVNYKQKTIITDEVRHKSGNGINFQEPGIVDLSTS